MMRKLIFRLMVIINNFTSKYIVNHSISKDNDFWDSDDLL